MDEWVGRLIENRKCLKKGGRKKGGRNGMNSGSPYRWIQCFHFPTGFLALALTKPSWHVSPSFLPSLPLHKQVSPRVSSQPALQPLPAASHSLLCLHPSWREGRALPKPAALRSQAETQSIFSRVEHRLEGMSLQGDRQSRGVYSLPSLNQELPVISSGQGNIAPTTAASMLWAPLRPQLDSRSDPIHPTLRPHRLPTTWRLLSLSLSAALGCLVVGPWKTKGQSSFVAF